MVAAHAASRRLRPDDAAGFARRPATFAALVATFILVIFVASPGAQQAAFSPGARVAAPPAATEINLLVGRSTVLNTDRPIERVSLTTPEIADALVTSPQQILIHGKAPGTISLFLWDRAGGIKSFEVNVRRDLSQLAEQMRQLFPGEPIGVAGNGRDVVLSGTVSSKYIVERAADVAVGYVEKKENVVNLLKQQEGVASNQVMLRVRFAEISRSALQELGISFFSDGNNNRYGRVTTQQFAAPFFDQKSADLGKTLVFSDYLNVFLFDIKNQLGGVIKALSDKGLFQSLAEPNLIATNGKEASFLAGGEYPYPVVQGAATGASVTIQFKEFGIRLRFTPTILGGDIVHLKVAPEVSALDFNNAVIVEGFRIPALTTRRAETEVELNDGQTFAIAGLLNNTVSESMRKVPGLGDIPILGLLFKSRAHQKQQTELVVMITPQILKRGSVGVAPGLPNLAVPFLQPSGKEIPPPPPYAPRGEEEASSPAQTLSKEEQQRAEAAQLAEARARAEELRRTSAEAQKAAAERKKQEKVAAEQAKRDAEAARRAAVEAEKQRKEQEKLQRETDARQAEAARRAWEEAERARAEEAKLARERAKKQAEADKKAAEVAKKQQKEQEDRARVLAEAEARLREAQAKYQAELKKQTKPGGL
jgi:pilus assembly protein CpaC